MTFRVLAAVLCAAAFSTFATPQLRNATDMWFDPAESGWGLNVIHQGDTLFATLFVYGPDGQPRWYVGSELRGGDDGPLHDRPAVYTGSLYETTGPWLGAGSFDPGSVTRRQVGSMTLELADDVSLLRYSVDGVQVTKQVRRFTFRRANLDGAYEGYIYQPATSGAPEVKKTDFTLNIRDNGSTFSMDSLSDSQVPCEWTGTPAHNGQLEYVSGTYRCGSVSSGQFSMKVDPTTEGFTGSFTGYDVSSFWGRIAAARSTGTIRMQGHGWRNDMWFHPDESGWGLNVIEQDDTLFATLFAYDAQRRPRWYVASELAQQGDSTDGAVTYSGALFESTGPYFGAAFNPASVARRQVGQMTFRARPDGWGDLAYSVDGVQVAKQVRRFAFRKQDFSGTYFGSYAHDRQATITIDDRGPDFRMQVVDHYGGYGTCDFVAPYSQAGSLRTMSGTFTCAGPSAVSGTFVMRHATVSFNGFTARFDSPLYGFRTIVDGHLAGVRREAN